MVYTRFDHKLPFVLCSLLIGLGCSSTKDDSVEGAMTGGGVGGTEATTGGMSGAIASGGVGGANATGGMGGAAGMITTTGGVGGGVGGVSGAAGTGEAGTAAGMSGMGGEGGGAPDDGPQPNPDGVDDLPPLDAALTLPIVFVHGFAGSAQQYDSQAQRFAANGYPLERIVAFDHDGAGFDTAAYANGVDEVIDKALADFDAAKVYLVGHSRGTFVSSDYLGSSARAAKVAKYISLDGSGCLGVPVPCIEPTQSAIPGQAHVEVATSAESFVMQYQFLIGSAPTVVDIVPQKEPVTLHGRAVSFPANTGRANTTLDIWEIEEATGVRIGATPYATFALPADGGFGPVVVDSRKRYEFALVPTEGSTHHLYMQRFLRDTNFVRLLSGDSNSPTRMNTNTSDTHSTFIAMRNREWYATDTGAVAGDQTDTLEISTSSESAGDVAVVNALQRFVGNGTIGLHIHDAAASPGNSTLTALPYFQSQAFQNGIDVFMPAADPPDGTITVTNIPRGVTAKPQVFNIPNWASSKHAVTLMFADFAQ